MIKELLIGAALLSPGFVEASEVKLAIVDSDAELVLEPAAKWGLTSPASAYSTHTGTFLKVNTIDKEYYTACVKLPDGRQGCQSFVTLGGNTSVNVMVNSYD